MSSATYTIKATAINTEGKETEWSNTAKRIKVIFELTYEDGRKEEYKGLLVN